MPLIYKICPEALWHEAQALGRFDGAPVDLADGYIHFSTGAQVRETAARHFAGKDGLLLVAIEADELGKRLRYEVSRGGALFPHLHGTFDPKIAVWVKPLPLGADGIPLVPEDVA